MRSPITTHVLDTSLGKPAAGISVSLEMLEGENWKEIGAGVTNEDGRVGDLLAVDHSLQKGVYKITFDTSSYFQNNSTQGFYPYVPIIFEIVHPQQHYHVPLLLNPYGYSTYRGS